MVFLFCRLMEHFITVAEQKLKRRIKNAFPDLSSEMKLLDCYNNVLKCIEKSQYVSGKKSHFRSCALACHDIPGVSSQNVTVKLFEDVDIS